MTRPAHAQHSKAAAPSRRKRRTVVIAAGIALALGLASGTAFAAFTASATGSGVASVAAAEPVDVTAIVGSPALQPGSSSSLSFVLANPNPYTVTITGIAQRGTAATVSVTGGAACSGVAAGVSVPTATSLKLPVPPGAHEVTLQTAGVMSTASANGCQGATFHVPVSLEVRRQ